MNNNPLVSIIIPTYNRANIISETLDSVLSQTYTNWECIIVDDGSTDNSYEIIESYLRIDSRFFYYNRPNDKLKGGNAARNYGLKVSKGVFINWFDSDDIMLTDFISKKINILLDNNELDFCSCYSKILQKPTSNKLDIIEKPKILNSKNYIEDYFFNGLYFYTASPLWRRSFLDNFNLNFDENLLRGQERDFHLRVLLKKPKYLYLDNALFLVRKDEENSIGNRFNKNLSLQLSHFNYYDKTFDLLKENNQKKYNNVLKYFFYRQSANYMNIINMAKKEFTIKHKIKYFKYLLKYYLIISVSRKYLFKLYTGFFLFLIFKRGYSFFYFPEFDFRNDKK